jgi:hypothetical protein
MKEIKGGGGTFGEGVIFYSLNIPVGQPDRISSFFLTFSRQAEVEET